MSNFFSKEIENSNYIIYKVSLDEFNTKEVIDCVLEFMNIGDEFSVTYLPFENLAVGDCIRVVRKLNASEYQAKQGMHGSRGCWYDITLHDAAEWLEFAVRKNFDLLGTHQRCIYQLKSRKTSAC